MAGNSAPAACRTGVRYPHACLSCRYSFDDCLLGRSLACNLAGFRPSVPLGHAIQFVLAHFAAQRVAVNAQFEGRLSLIAFGAFQSAGYKFFLKFRPGFVQQNPAFNH